jgi:hypothetical protein
MVDIKPTNAATPTGSISVSSNATVASVTPVNAIVANAPSQIQQLLRQIQLTGTLSAPPSATTITLSTALGDVTLSLPQLTADMQQKIVQQLIALFQNQRSLSVILQPGNPLQQAVILLPQPANTTSGAGNLQSTTGLQIQTQPATVGTVLTAIILPTEVTQSIEIITPQISINNPSTLTLLPSNIPAPNQPLSPPVLTDIIVPQNFQPTVDAKEATAQQPLATNINILLANEIDLPPTTPTSLPPNGTPPTSETVTIQISAPEDGTQIKAPLSATVSPDYGSLHIDTSAIPTDSLYQSGHTPLQQPATQQIQLRIDAITLPNSAAPEVVIQLSDNPDAVESQINATIISKSVNGGLILQSADTTLYVRESVNLPVGTTLLLTATSPNPVQSLGLADLSNTGLGSLQQILAALNQIDPQLAQQVTNAIVPQPNAQLPGTLLFFLNVLQQGDFHNWLGATASEKLARIGKYELINRLAIDIKMATETTRDAVVGEWRSYPIPLRLDQHMEMLKLYVHPDPQKYPDHVDLKPDTKCIRFLIEVRMSRLGQIQLDGMVQPKNLNMIVRSEHALPVWLGQDLRATYTNMLEATGFNGGLVFQTGRQHWLTMQHKGTSREI